MGQEVWLQNVKTGGDNLWDRRSVITKVRESGSYELEDEHGTKSLRNGKLIKPVYGSRPAPTVETGKRLWTDVVKNKNKETTVPERQSMTSNISRSTLLWNNAVENAAQKIRNEKKKGVSFDEGCKTVDGGTKLKRRSERLKDKIKSSLRFVRKIRPSGSMTWGPFTYILSLIHI